MRSPATITALLQLKQPNRFLQNLICTCAALQCLFRGTSPLGNTGICAGPAIPIKPGFVQTEASQTKHKASRSPSTKAILYFARGFGRHSYLFPHLTIQSCAGWTPGPCPSPHRRTWEFRLCIAQALGMQCRAYKPAEHPRAAHKEHPRAARREHPRAARRQHPTEHPMKPHKQFKDQYLAFSGLKLSH